MIRRRFLSTLLAASFCATLTQAALAKSGGAKLLVSALPGMAVEYWDEEGLFHLVSIELLVEYEIEGVKVSNKITDAIVRELAMIPWEELNRENPALIIKRIALDIARSDGAAGSHVKDVLISRLLLR